MDKNQRAARIKEIEQDTAKKMDEVFERAWNKDWNNERPKFTPKEKRYMIIGWLFLLVGFVGMVIPALGVLNTSYFIGVGLVCLGFVLRTMGEWKRSERTRSLPPPS